MAGDDAAHLREVRTLVLTQDAAGHAEGGGVSAEERSGQTQRGRESKRETCPSASTD